jgi:molybdopterin/thiamine biosynthesis adenylyltransferase
LPNFPSREIIWQSMEEWLIEQCMSCRPLKDAILQEYQAVHGWHLQVVVQKAVIDFYLVLSQDWPFEPPTFYLVDKSLYLRWPHVEKNGKLCLQHGSTVEVSPYRPLEVVKFFFDETLSLLDQLATEQLTSDFLDEFETYWSLGVSVNSQPIHSLLPSTFHAGKISVWRGRSFSVVAENADTIRAWMENRFNTIPDGFTSGLLISLRSRFTPSEFPKTGVQFRNLLEKYCSDFDESMFNDFLMEQDAGLVVLGTQSSLEPSFVGVEIYKKQISRFSKHRSRKQTHARVNGFRDGRCPSSVAISNFLANAVVTQQSIQRADAEWIHGGRGKDVRRGILQKQAVLVIGVGSIGSFVANCLAQAGVGRLGFVDPDSLSWANTGRHFLGAESVGGNKAQSMKEKLLKQYPTIQECIAVGTRWEHAIRKNATLFDRFDLILSLTGSWCSDAGLNDWAMRNPSKCQFMFGWLEPFAAAGHVVSITKGGGCLQCGFSETGQPNLRVFEWPYLESTMLKESGCGTYFQPYGVAETQHTIAMITETVIENLLSPPNTPGHRVWVRKEGPFDSSGRQFTQNWSELYPALESDRVFHRTWPSRSDCPRCSK